jgi:hypothetical protein
MKPFCNNFKNYFTFIGIICISVPIYLFILWQHATSVGTNQLESVEIFHSNLPTFLHSYNSASLLGFIFSFSAMIFCIINIKTNNRLMKTLNKTVLILGALFALLNLFYMM